jgi:phosphoglycolate phosphatase-like HAD superfamily hydrolase
LGLNPVLIWDIDGTILTTRGRGFPSMVRAVQEVTGLAKISEIYTNTHGQTDIDVIRNLYGNQSKSISKNDLNIILKLYEKYIEEVFYLNPPLILPNILETFNLIKSSTKYKMAIGTGNSFNGARIKLQTARIIHFFSKNNFHCADVNNDKRMLVIREAKKNIRNDEFGIVIGDTLSDIICAKENGISCIAIASGSFSFDELQKYGADIVLDTSWTPDELLFSVKKIQKYRDV